MATSAGELTFTINVDASQMLTAQRTVTVSVNNMSSNINTLTTSTNNAAGGFNRLSTSVAASASPLNRVSSLVAGISAALATDRIIAYADAWTTVGNKITNYLKTGQNLVDVQESLYKVANDTRTPLQAVATLYGRLEPATRGIISSGSELLKVTDTINKAFVVSGATGEEATASVVQLAQALGAGALRGEEFNSINEQAPRIMQGIAESMGVARGELKVLAGQGKLTTEVIIKAFQDMSGSVDAEFSKMNATFGQKGTIALNNLTKAFGQNDDVIAAVATIGDAMIKVSENINPLISGVSALAVAFSVKLAASIGKSVAAKMTDIAATRAQAAAVATSAAATETSALATVQSAEASLTSAATKVKQAQSTLALVTAERAYLSSAQATLSAQLSSATTEKERTAIRLQLIKYSQAMVAAANEESAAIARLSALERGETEALAALTAAKTAATEATVAKGLADRAAAGAQVALNGVMGLMGGPTGIAMLAAGAIYYYVSATNEAKKANEDFAASLDSSIQGLERMTNAQLNAAKYRLQDTLHDQTEALKDQQAKVDELTKKYKAFSNNVPVERMREGSYEFDHMTELQRDLAIETEKLEQKDSELTGTKNRLYAVLQSLNGAISSNAVELKNEGDQTGFVAKMTRDLNAELGIQNKLRGQASPLIKPIAPESKGFKERKAELLALQKQEENYGTAKAARAAEDEKSRQAGITDPAEIARLGDIAVKNFEIAAARKEATKESKASASAAKKDETAQQQVTDKMSDTASKAAQLGIEYNNLKKGIDDNSAATSRFTIESATLEAQRQLGAAATKEQIEAQAANILKIHEETAAIDKLKKKQAEDVQTTQKFETVESKTKTKGQSVDDQYTDDLKALNNYHKMAGASDARYQKTKSKLEEKYRKDKQAAAIEDYKAQSEWNTFLMDGLDALGQSATTTIAGLASGTMTATEAMQNFANIILNQAVGALVEMGLNQIKNTMLSDSMAATQQANIVATNATGIAAGSANASAQAANAATVAAAAAPAAAATATFSWGTAAVVGGAALLATYAIAKSAGGRQFGGSVNAGGMYRVGENGRAEVFTQGGRNYLLPGDGGGQVTPMSGMGGGGFSQNVSIVNTSGASVSHNTSADGKQMRILVEQTVSKSISEKRGRIYSAFNRTTNLQSRAR